METQDIVAEDLRDGDVLVSGSRTFKIANVRHVADFVFFTYSGPISSHTPDRMKSQAVVTIEVREEPEKLYLVHQHCGEAFDTFESAHAHVELCANLDSAPGEEEFKDGFNLLPESEAM